MDEGRALLRKQIYLTRDLNRRLRAAAESRGATESCLIREALEEYLAAEERRRT
ncbi:MAG: ribbon-helix-helix protein, CopG family, partial [Firmicutes bacterium]|nr:ribbon-helix-helix protein, CopG family [Bacillota bacterium]